MDRWWADACAPRSRFRSSRRRDPDDIGAPPLGGPDEYDRARREDSEAPTDQKGRDTPKSFAPDWSAEPW